MYKGHIIIHICTYNAENNDLVVQPIMPTHKFPFPSEWRCLLNYIHLYISGLCNRFIFESLISQVLESNIKILWNWWWDLAPKAFSQTKSGCNRQREINFVSKDCWWKTEALFFSHWYIGLDHWARLPGSSGKYVISSLNAITSVLRVIKVLSSHLHIVQTSCLWLAFYFQFPVYIPDQHWTVTLLFCTLSPL